MEPIASEDNIGGEDDDEVKGMTNRMTLEDDKELRSVSSNLGRIPSDPAKLLRSFFIRSKVGQPCISL